MAVNVMNHDQSENEIQLKTIAVSFRLLLGLYSIIPLCLLLQLIDSNFFGNYLQQALPASSRHFIFYQIIFGTPHIVASSILMTSNVEYLKFYWVKITVMTLALAVFFGIGSQVISYRVLYVLVACWTVLHVLKQQHGIARGVCGISSLQFNLQLWLSVAAGILIYIGIFSRNSLNPEHAEMITYVAGGLCVFLAGSTVVIVRTVKTVFGKVFLWANSLLVLSSYYLFISEYYFLAILVPRLVHDTTAFIFYVTHDYNRHYGHPRNFIYRTAKKLKINIFIVLPLISFALAFGLRQYGDYYFDLITEFLFGTDFRKAISFVFLGYLALMHYYTESFTWKGDSPYRRYIAFSR